MEFKELGKLVNEIKNELKKNNPDYNFFKTEAGIIFQEDFVNLLGYVSFENLFPKFVSLLPQFFEILINEQEDNFKDKFKVRFQLIQNEKIIEDKTITLEETLSALIQQNEIFDVIKERNPERLERINAYYVIALNTIMDGYTSNIFEKLIKKYCQPHLFDLLNYRKPIGSPINQINLIRSKLDLISDKKFYKLLDETTWKNDLKNLYKIRNILAHENPKIRLQKLNDDFPTIFKNIKTKVQNIFQQSEKQFKNHKVFNQLKELLEPSFQILQMLTEISKICYAYLAINDNLINEYFKSHKNL